MTMTRFAPSPTGLLHVGNARIAILSYLFSQSQHGKFALRIDDTDIEKSQDEYKSQIKQILNWLGIKWEIYVQQSDRMSQYNKIITKLKHEAHLYPCYETKEELDIKRKIQLSSGKPPIYDRAALELSPKQMTQYENESKKPHWRLKLQENQEIKWKDLIKGDICFNTNNLSDPILIRENGTLTYMLPSVIDDADLQISHVFRGEDHVSNTAIQIQIFKIISAEMPEFGHFPLMKSKDGKISKREGGYDLEALKNQGIEAMTIANYLTNIGTSGGQKTCKNMAELAENFDTTRYGNATLTFDAEELQKLNPQILQNLSYSQVKERIDVEEKVWDALKNNIEKLQDIENWLPVFSDDFRSKSDHKHTFFCEKASQTLPKNPWNENTWKEWMDALKKNTDRKGKDLFMPLRMALTGRDRGPEMAKLLPLIGRERVILRLKEFMG